LRFLKPHIAAHAGGFLNIFSNMKKVKVGYALGYGYLLKILWGTLGVRLFYNTKDANLKAVCLI
jgi:hypothetical protein